MKKLILIGFITILLLVGSTTGMHIRGTNSIIYVDDDNILGPWDGTLEHPYMYIQDAIDNANNDYTIRVFAGFYENPKGTVHITKTLSIIGNGSTDTFVNRSVSITADNVLFRGFTVNGSDYVTLKKSCCIRMKNSNSCNINNNTIVSGLCGIELYDSHDNNIENITLAEQEKHKPSIYLYSSNRNTIKQNYIDIDNSDYGIYLDHCQNNIIDNNRIYEDGTGYFRGYFLLNSHNNTISRNRNNFTDEKGNLFRLKSSDYNKIVDNIINIVNTAMSLSSSCNNIISGNILSDLGYGILLGDKSNNNIIQNNLLKNTYQCIRLGNCCENIIKSNEIIENRIYGIRLYDGAKDNTIHNNIIQDNGNNSWSSWSGGIVFMGENGRIIGNTICLNNIKNNYVGINLRFGNTNNIIEKNNFIGNERHVDFRNSWGNTWDSNYWDNWIGFGPKLIPGKIMEGPVEILWINIDWNPAKEPYDI